jgi:hypothetical protein
MLMFCHLAVQACPIGRDPNTLEYSRRDNNRCEGLKDRNASINLSLVSFATGFSNFATYPSTLSIHVPSKKNTPLDIEIQSYARNYRLDDLATTFRSKGFFFSLDTRILSRVDVPLKSLLALAYTRQNSHRVYFPVILGKATGQYEFVVTSSSRVTFPTFEIRVNGKPIYKVPKTISANRHTLMWKYGGAETGTYQLYLVDNQGQSKTFWFEHNPNLF